MTGRKWTAGGTLALEAAGIGIGAVSIRPTADRQRIA